MGNSRELCIGYMKAIQEEIYLNKVEKFGTPKSIEREFCYAYGELSESFDAFLKEDGTVGEELADVAIYLFGIAEHLGVNLCEEVFRKMEKNKGRLYHIQGSKFVRDSE